MVRIALANIAYGPTPDAAVANVQRAIAEAGAQRADIDLTFATGLLASRCRS